MDVYLFFAGIFQTSRGNKKKEIHAPCATWRQSVMELKAPVTGPEGSALSFRIPSVRGPRQTVSITPTSRGSASDGPARTRSDPFGPVRTPPRWSAPVRTHSSAGGGRGRAGASGGERGQVGARVTCGLMSYDLHTLLCQRFSFFSAKKSPPPGLKIEPLYLRRGTRS